MQTNRDYSDLSGLEREIELEMDDELERELEASDELEGAESENDDRERDDVLELEGGADAGSDIGHEFQAGDEELGHADGDREREYVERFLEIAAHEFESESEVDQAMNETLTDVANEYLFGSLWKKAASFGKNLAKNSVVRALVNKGLSVASGQFPALKAALQLAKGNLQGALLNLGKQALGTAIPGGGAALGALKALGFESAEDAQSNRTGWENYVALSREAFEHLANNVTPSADQPLEANRLAATAFQHAVRRAQARVAQGTFRHGSRRLVSGQHGRVVRHHLRPGDKIVITGARKLIVRGG
jgi:hypothetical protein